MLTISEGHINYITNNEIYLISLDTIPAAPQAIVSITEEDLTEALKKTACKVAGDDAALYPAPSRVYCDFLWSCKYSVGNRQEEELGKEELGVATITKVPAGPGKFRFILRVYQCFRWRNQVSALDYEEAGPAQPLAGTCENGTGSSLIRCPEAIRT